MHYLLFYDYVDDYLERRAVFRDQHLRLAWQAHADGHLVLAGVLDEPLDSAVLLFEAESREVVEAFVAEDPYVSNGLVRSWRIRPWRTVVGATAGEPVRPD